MIFLDTNVISETFRPLPDHNVQRWLRQNEPDLAVSTVVLAELVFGMEKIRPDQRSKRLENGINEWRRRLSTRIVSFTEEAAISYGTVMGAATRQGPTVSSMDGMIAAIARVNHAPLATRNTKDFQFAGIVLINPWMDRHL